ncbi:MAG TPA: sigma-70 family RNA polymerase sigma factor [Terriglobales bacterium]
MIAESAMAGGALKLAQKAAAQIASAEREEDLLATAVRQHARLVYRIAYSILRNDAEAEDATQETFLRALRYGKKMAGINDQKAWLARIAWRVAVERRKRVATAAAKTEEAGETLVSSNHGADRILLENERNAALEQLIASLPSRLRDPLVLSTLEEIAPREVAAMLGISEAAVRSRSFRAREILRGKLLAFGRART